MNLACNWFSFSLLFIFFVSSETLGLRRLHRAALKGCRDFSYRQTPLRTSHPPRGRLRGACRRGAPRTDGRGDFQCYAPGRSC